MMNPSEVAKEWGVAEGTVRKLLREHRLEGVKIGSNWRIPREAMEAYEEQNRSKVVPVEPRSIEPVRRPVITQII